MMETNDIIHYSFMWSGWYHSRWIMGCVLLCRIWSYEPTKVSMTTPPQSRSLIFPYFAGFFQRFMRYIHLLYCQRWRMFCVYSIALYINWNQICISYICISRTLLFTAYLFQKSFCFHFKKVSKSLGTDNSKTEFHTSLCWVLTNWLALEIDLFFL